MSVKNPLNIVWEKCHHGVEKRHYCHQCKDEQRNFLYQITKQTTTGPRRIPIKRGCEAASQGGCFCTGRCNEIVGYRDPLPGE